MSTNQDVEENKSLVSKYYKALYSIGDGPQFSDVLDDDYVEHQLTAGYSRDGLVDYARGRVEENPDHEIVIHRTIAADDHVFLHVEEKLSDSTRYARGELFRIEDGLIAEHWGTEQEVQDRAVHGNGMFDGPGVDVSVEVPDGSVDALIHGYYESFVNFDVDASHACTGSGMIQHNPEIPDGVDAYESFLELLQNNNMQPRLDIRRSVLEGNFCVTHSYVNIEPMFGNCVVFDIFRLNSEGKKEEHWDVLQAIPSEADIERIL